MNWLSEPTSLLSPHPRLDDALQTRQAEAGMTAGQNAIKACNREEDAPPDSIWLAETTGLWSDHCGCKTRCLGNRTVCCPLLIRWLESESAFEVGRLGRTVKSHIVEGEVKQLWDCITYSRLTRTLEFVSSSNQNCKRDSNHGGTRPNLATLYGEASTPQQDSSMMEDYLALIEEYAEFSEKCMAVYGYKTKYKQQMSMMGCSNVCFLMVACLWFESRGSC
ncbi:unnamed protein product [Protopolystoma xenopodis]|uniref:Uncharacterized protein n=1 Tax=Protopolystoma xenopodis TaxID=117903 RepID=A0A448WNH9_9PLAT|nr:unnamed protein product [Protopolystoma xenopodis]